MTAPTAWRVPVIAVTGHLGSGKTTLVNHLLRRPGARLGVVVNDFGTLNVDAALVAGQIDDAAAISGGCLCCLEDAGGLDEALARLTAPALRLDAVLVEASGVAEPRALAKLIRYSGAEHARPGGLIDVVDAVEYFATVDVREAPPTRHASASLVLIGKSDLLPAAERESTLARITERVRASNPRATIVVARRGAIDPALPFDTATDRDPQDELPIAALMREGSHAHDHARAVSVPLPHPVSPSALVDLVEAPPTGAYRIKGRVAVRGAGGHRGYLAEVVGRTVHVAALGLPPGPGEVVAIGADLDEAEAQERFAEVAASDDGRPDPAGLRRLRRWRRVSA